MEVTNTDYQSLLISISQRYEQGRANIAAYVNTKIVNTYWQIGQYIVVFEQGGNAKATYGKALIENLSKDLSLAYGKGFSRSNLNYMRLFYQRFPICEEVPHKLSWTHFCELVKIDDPLERSFYQQQAILENWSTTELKRQKKSSLFLRLAASKDKSGILQLAQQGQLLEKPADILREPYVLEFLKIPEPYHLSETDLEAKLIEHLQTFLLELGKGFAFIGRQYRINLKKGEAGYEAVGQMNMYLGYFENEENTEGDNPPIGIVLAKEKDDLLVQYAMHNITSQLFVSKYQLYLPNREELQALIEKQFHNDNQ